MFFMNAIAIILFLCCLISLVFVNISNNALTAAMSFLFMIFWSIMCLFFYVDSFIPYLLFLVYIGGLLVLMVYMVALSSNHLIVPLSKFMWFCITCFLFLLSVLFYFLCKDDLMFLKNITQNLSLLYSCVSVVVLFLLYVFLNICSILRIGGQTFNIGNTT
uniref:NADH dehydrogenase subunit 6 n=1 Tax=Camaenella platyodon TaxID=2566149 RepID=A0A4D6T494_9EUPU|nr:NADH dehydrogenase subunit 6 [Camaenella platyodon]